MDNNMKHVVLLGDSVFDNASYVAGGWDVVSQLRQRLPAGWRASLRAVDGSVIADVPKQLARMPTDATHLVISIGGNDALRSANVLDAPVRSVAESLVRLDEIRRRFQHDYGAMLETVLRCGLPTAVCTVYDPRYSDPMRRRIAITALSVINDGIIREAVGRGVPVLDLRVICGEDSDFANPIEPSVQGGWKIAGAIAAMVSEHDFSRRRSEVFAR